MFRFIIRYLANNDKLVNRLSESYFMRRAAQLTLAAFYRSKTFMHDNNLHTMTPEKFRQLMRSFQGNLKQEIEAAKREFERKNKKGF